MNKVKGMLSNRWPVLCLGIVAIMVVSVMAVAVADMTWPQKQISGTGNIVIATPSGGNPGGGVVEATRLFDVTNANGATIVAVDFGGTCLAGQAYTSLPVNLYVKNTGSVDITQVTAVVTGIPDGWTLNGIGDGGTAATYGSVPVGSIVSQPFTLVSPVLSVDTPVPSFTITFTAS